MTPMLQARLLAVKRRLMLRFRGGFNPYPAAPDGIELSPSTAHFHDVDAAPLARARGPIEL